VRAQFVSARISFGMRGHDAVGFASSETLACRWLGALAECGDPLCSCHRLAWPHIRPTFARVIAETALGAAPRALRYVSLGSGML
jgi:hypothetical protein